MPVEDVVTTGSSLDDILEQLLEAGLTVNAAIALINRQQGGVQNLAARGVKVHAVMTQVEALEKLPDDHPRKKFILNWAKAKAKEHGN
jgi:orotate phosphoribosyltransferase